MTPNCETRKTSEPMLATRSAMYLLVPLMSATTRIRVETDRMMPSNIRNERSLCVRMVSKAMAAGSRMERPRFIQILSKYYVRQTCLVPFKSGQSVLPGHQSRLHGPPEALSKDDVQQG